MPARTVRVRRLEDGHFEFLDPVHIPEREFEVIVNEPTVVPAPAESSELPLHDGTILKEEITREDIYGDR